MLGRNGEHPFHFPQLHPAQRRNCRWFVGGADDQIGAAFTQGFPDSFEHFLGDPQRHAGTQRIELADHRDQVFELQQFIGDDPQPALPAIGHLLHPLRQARDILHQPRCFVDQQLTGRGQLQAIATTVEQQSIETLFQLPRGIGHRGRCLAQLDCGP
ncbi:hypothetical protein D3C87_1344270 [compost metagenome]